MAETGQFPVSCQLMSSVGVRLSSSFVLSSCLVLVYCNLYVIRLLWPRLVSFLFVVW